VTGDLFSRLAARIATAAGEALRAPEAAVYPADDDWAEEVEQLDSGPAAPVAPPPPAVEVPGSVTPPPPVGRPVADRPALLRDPVAARAAAAPGPSAPPPAATRPPVSPGEPVRADPPAPDRSSPPAAHPPVPAAQPAADLPAAPVVLTKPALTNGVRPARVGVVVARPVPAPAPPPPPAWAPGAAASGAPAAPVVEVTIGRIEVRAVAAPAARPSVAERQPAPTPLSLAEYLRRREGGRP
jgi:translation initiation factor IF-2